MLLSTFFGFVFGVLALFVFAFILWKKLKEDYHAETIFKFTLALLFGVGVGAWIAAAWAPQFVFWASLVGGVLTGFLYSKRLNLRFFEVVDGTSLASLAFLFTLYLGQVVKILPGVSYFVLAKTAVLFLLFFLYGYFLKSYRRFRWYPSGKVGFAGLLTLALFFLLRGIISLAAQIYEPTTLLATPYLSLSTEVVNVILSLFLFAILVRTIWLRR